MLEHLELLQNEGIILQHDDIGHKHNVYTMVLTNLNIICVNSRGVFKKKYNLIKYPLTQIKIINNTPNVSIQKGYASWILQISMLNGIEKFEFSYSHYNPIEKSKAKADITKWVDQISMLLTGNAIKNTDNAFIGGVKNLLESVGIKQKVQSTNHTTSKCIGCMAPITGIEGEKVSCKYCDTEQTL